jgi:hypothetical protein
MNNSDIVARVLTPEEQKRIDNNFIYHKPQGNQPQKYEVIRGSGKTLALTLCRLCPESRELSLALTKLEEAIFWANAAIARNEKPNDGK